MARAPKRANWPALLGIALAYGSIAYYFVVGNHVHDLPAVYFPGLGHTATNAAVYAFLVVLVGELMSAFGVAFSIVGMRRSSSYVLQGVAAGGLIVSCFTVLWYLLYLLVFYWAIWTIAHYGLP